MLRSNELMAMAVVVAPVSAQPTVGQVFDCPEPECWQNFGAGFCFDKSGKEYDTYLKEWNANQDLDFCKAQCLLDSDSCWGVSWNPAYNNTADPLAKPLRCWLHFEKALPPTIAWDKRYRPNSATGRITQADDTGAMCTAPGSNPDCVVANGYRCWGRRDSTTVAPTATRGPTLTPSLPPTRAPTTPGATFAPTRLPSGAPTLPPSSTPASPTKSPTLTGETYPPSPAPSKPPTATPSSAPTRAPTVTGATFPPSRIPLRPTQSPTAAPSATPTTPTGAPTPIPVPTKTPFSNRTGAPVSDPTRAPTMPGQTWSPQQPPSAEPSSSPETYAPRVFTKWPTYQAIHYPSASPDIVTKAPKSKADYTDTYTITFTQPLPPVAEPDKWLGCKDCGWRPEEEEFTSWYWVIIIVFSAVVCSISAVCTALAVKRTFCLETFNMNAMCDKSKMPAETLEGTPEQLMELSGFIPGSPEMADSKEAFRQWGHEPEPWGSPDHKFAERPQGHPAPRGKFGHMPKGVAPNR